MHPTELFFRRRLPNLGKLTPVTHGPVYDHFKGHHFEAGSGTRIFSLAKSCPVQGAKRRTIRTFTTYFLVDDTTFALMEKAQNPDSVWEVVGLEVRNDCRPYVWQQVVASFEVKDPAQDPVFWSCPSLHAVDDDEGDSVDVVYAGERGAESRRFRQHELVPVPLAA